ncbi:MAG: AAA family ATPase [Actinobacteria bacterium]|nr:AAA family ATPase [Actinomycetota bacterium]
MRTPDVLTEKLDFNPLFKKALQLMEESAKNVLVTGRAGTGKSTLLEYFRSIAEKEIVVLAPTGVAAVNVSGQTIHSFFRFSLDVTAKSIKSLDDPIYKKMDAIVIDEVSMVRADLLDWVDKFLQVNGRVKGAPFGGVQMIFIGDLYQLPPVVRGEQERKIFRDHYESEYFFDSLAFKGAEFEHIELEKVYRQTDEFFIRLLNGVRNKSITDEEIELINARCVEDLRALPDDAIHLTTTNAMASERNELELSKLKGKTYTFEADIKGDFKETSFPADEVLRIKKGAQVMLLNNDPAGRWVNGTIGAVHDIKGDFLRIRLADGDVEEVYPFTWKNYRFFWNEKTKSVESAAAGTFTQYPVRLAWAVTIHKSQGKTFDSVVIDIGRGTFAPGQLYVALSRCRTFDGIFLKKKIRKSNIWLDWRVVKFLTGYQYERSEKRLPLEAKVELLGKAIENGSHLEITYLKPDDTKSRRVIKPECVQEMEYNGSRFLGLKAYCLQREADRTFRVDRILEMKERLPGSIETPTPA